MADDNNNLDVEVFDEDIRKRNRRNTYIFVAAIVLVVLAAIVSALLVNKYVITSYEIDGVSMYPTLYGATYDEDGNKIIGDYVYLNKSKKSYKYGDIIVFVAETNPDGTEIKYVKRVIGVPGDTIELKNDKVYINGEAKEEPYINQDEDVYYDYLKIVVPENSYFVMGDNRNHSTDSRFKWADNNHCIKQECIIGKAFLIKHASGKISWIKKVK